MIIMSDLKNPQFYKYCRKYDFNRAVDTALSDNIISESDKGLILEYVLERQALNNLSDIRCNKIASSIIGFRRFMAGNYAACSIADIYQAVNKMQSGLSRKGKPLKTNTKRDYIVILKPFLLWLIDSGYSNLPPKKIRALKPLPAERSTVAPDDLLTSGEVMQLIQACKNPRDRALISVLYESGVRVAELGRLCWGDVIFDEYGVKLYIDDRKNRQHRYSRLVISTEYLAKWRNDYPRSVTPAAPVFIDLTHGNAIHYDAIVRLLERVQRRAGIQKSINPHLFRHTRITHMIQQNYQESIIKKSMWNNLNTEMFSVYVSLSESDIDNEFLAKTGIEKKASTDHNPLLPITCGECQHINPPDAQICNRCGLPLTAEAEMMIHSKIRSAVDYIESDPDFKEFYQEYMVFLEAQKAYKMRGNKR